MVWTADEERFDRFGRHTSPVPICNACLSSSVLDAMRWAHIMTFASPCPTPLGLLPNVMVHYGQRYCLLPRSFTLSLWLFLALAPVSLHGRVPSSVLYRYYQEERGLRKLRTVFEDVWGRRGSECGRAPALQPEVCCSWSSDQHSKRSRLFLLLIPSAARACCLPSLGLKPATADRQLCCTATATHTVSGPVTGIGIRIGLPCPPPPSQALCLAHHQPLGPQLIRLWSCAGEPNP